MATSMSNSRLIKIFILFITVSGCSSFASFLLYDKLKSLYIDEIIQLVEENNLPEEHVYAYFTDEPDYSEEAKRKFVEIMKLLTIEGAEHSAPILTPQLTYYDGNGNRLVKNFIGCASTEQEIDQFIHFYSKDSIIKTDTSRNIFTLPIRNIKDKTPISSLKGKYKLFVVITYNHLAQDFPKEYNNLQKIIKDKKEVYLIIVSSHLPAEVFNRNKSKSKYIKEEIIFPFSNK